MKKMKVSKITKAFYYALMRFFGGYRHIGRHSVVMKPIQIDGANNISIGNKTYIAHGAWLLGRTRKDNQPSLKIGDHVQIGHYAHITAGYNIEIQDSVLLADKVYISDIGHSYQNIDLPILAQNERILGQVLIGSGSWIGENVCIIGASVGKNCVVGANSVVISDIPDFCVAVGAPARIVKQYDVIEKRWVNV